MGSCIIIEGEEMSKWNKLLERLQQLDNSLRYDELAKILKTYGYEPTETSGGSSHITFRKAGKEPITIPRHSPIGKTYIRIIRDMTALEETENENS